MEDVEGYIQAVICSRRNTHVHGMNLATHFGMYLRAVISLMRYGQQCVILGQTKDKYRRFLAWSCSH